MPTIAAMIFADRPIGRFEQACHAPLPAAYRWVLDSHNTWLIVKRNDDPQILGIGCMHENRKMKGKDRIAKARFIQESSRSVFKE